MTTVAAETTAAAAAAAGTASPVETPAFLIPDALTGVPRSMPDNLDDIKDQLRDGKLVPLGTEREAFVSADEVGGRPKIGDVLPGAFMVTSNDVKPVEGWRVKVRPLVPPRPASRRRSTDG
jgi:hypothetical protein